MSVRANCRDSLPVSLERCKLCILTAGWIEDYGSYHRVRREAHYTSVRRIETLNSKPLCAIVASKNVPP